MLNDILKIKTLRNYVIKNDLASFIKKSFHAINPSTKYLHNWHIDLISEYLLACERREIKRLIINIPPRYLKSLCVTVSWPAWLLAQNPSAKIMAASYAHNLSVKHSLDSRIIMQSDWYREIFPKTVISSDQNEKAKFTTTARGVRIATSVGAGIIGEGAEFLIVDDPHNAVNVMSDTSRKQVLDWYDHSFSTRLDDKKNGVFVIVMQRLHKNDLSGYLLEKGGWELLSIPAVAEKKLIVDFGGVQRIIEEGEILHEEREGKKELAQIKNDMGSYAFAAQYQQNPILLEGGMIKPEWIRRYGVFPADNLRIVQSWDTAIKAGRNNDYSVCSTWVESENDYKLIDILRLKAEYPELKRNIVNFYEKYKPQAVLIEDKASGQSLLQDLRRETKIPVIGVMPVKDKVTRMAAVSPMFEAGKVAFPKKAEWLHDLECEIFSFPEGAHDDQVDSISQFLNWVRERRKVDIGVRRL